MHKEIIFQQLDLKLGKNYIKLSNSSNTIQNIDDLKIKYSIKNSSKYLKISVLKSCLKKMTMDKKLSTAWIRANHKTQPCDIQLILSILVEAKFGNYIIPFGRKRAVGIIMN